MRNILALIGLLVIGFVGLGWYMGWYKLSVSRSGDGKLQITTDVDTNKVTTDSSEFFKNAATVIGSHVEKTAQDAKNAAPTVPTGAPGGTPGPVVPPQGSSIAPEAPSAPILPTAPIAPVPQPPARGPIQLIPPK